MAVFPSWVPTRGDLIEFDVLDPQIVEIPDGAQLEAWPKFRELERRWLHFEWFTHAIAGSPTGVRTLVYDAASAYLMTLEAALQVLGKQLFGDDSSAFRAWLKEHHPEPYGLKCRGLRTMRHIEAHVRPGKLNIVGDQRGNSIFAGSSWGQTLPWCFPSLSQADLPKWPAFYDGELDEWNELVETNLAAELMRHVVAQAHGVALAAEHSL